jgi:hypothetical protein
MIDKLNDGDSGISDDDSNSGISARSRKDAAIKDFLEDI